MFDTLVESRSDTAQSAKNSAFFGITTVVMASFAVALFVLSLYSVNVSLGEEDLTLNSLVAPVPVPDNAPPPPPAPENKPQQRAAEEDAPKNFDVLKDPIDTLDSTQVAEKPSAERASGDVIRRDTPYQIGNQTARATGGASDGPVREGTGGGPPGPAIKPTPQQVQDEDAPPPPKPTPTPAAKPPAVVSGGVVNGKASNLVKPPYPPAAKAVKAAGAVNVQVLIDESGNVVSASATSGHPLLRAAAVQAARSSKFTPTTLSGQKVKVSGVIVYNFVAQ